LITTESLSLSLCNQPACSVLAARSLLGNTVSRPRAQLPCSLLLNLPANHLIIMHGKTGTLHPFTYCARLLQALRSPALQFVRWAGQGLLRAGTGRRPCCRHALDAFSSLLMISALMCTTCAAVGDALGQDRTGSCVVCCGVATGNLNQCCTGSNGWPGQIAHLGWASL
jgi:hypothetical protein